MNTQSSTLSRIRRACLRALLPTIGATTLLSACNSDSDNSVQAGYVEPTDVAVTGFKLKADTKILTGLDSVYFSIDLQRGIIYNADSLPKGTRITDIIPVITYSRYISSAVIKMENGTKRQGEIDYKTNPNDSVDFTGDVKLILTSSAGNYRTYTLRVNVHQEEPDSLCWGETALGKLPSRSQTPKVQRTISYKGNTLSMIQEQDGSYTLSTNPDPLTSQWSRTPLSLDFTPRLRTLTATDDNLWMLASDGTLHCSADGHSWNSTPHKWHNILGAYGNLLLGLQAHDGTYDIVSVDNAVPPVTIPTGFPIEDYTNMYSYRSQWMAAPIGILAGGVTSEGVVSQRVWAFDGNNWACLSQEAIPPLRGATLVPYYTYRRTGTGWKYTEFSTMLMLGGMQADGSLNHDTYISYDNGVNWAKASDMLQLPSYIPGMWMLDNTVAYKPMQAPLLPAGWNEMPKRQIPSWYRVNTSVSNDIISWECPYIFLYGGCNEKGELYNTIWRGVINRLTFTPII